jgi:hypothetical protein
MNFNIQHVFRTLEELIAILFYFAKLVLYNTLNFE